METKTKKGPAPCRVGVAPDASATCTGGGRRQPRGRPAPDAAGSCAGGGHGRGAAAAAVGEAGAGCGRGRGAMAAAGEELPELSGGAWWSSRAAVRPPWRPAPRDGHGCQTRAAAAAWHNSGLDGRHDGCEHGHGHARERLKGGAWQREMKG